MLTQGARRDGEAKACSRRRSCISDMPAFSIARGACSNALCATGPDRRASSSKTEPRRNIRGHDRSRAKGRDERMPAAAHHNVGTCGARHVAFLIMPAVPGRARKVNFQNRQVVGRARARGSRAAGAPSAQRACAEGACIAHAQACCCCCVICRIDARGPPRAARTLATLAVRH